MSDGRDDRSLGELFADLARETGTLVRQELRLAVSETGERLAEVGKKVATSLAAGDVMLLAAFLAIVAAIILGLIDLGLDWWLAALIVGIVLGLIEYALIKRAISAVKDADIMPHAAMEMVEEVKASAQELSESAKTAATEAVDHAVLKV